MKPNLQILYHGNCFDGVVSAAIFTRFFQEVMYPGAAIAYRAMAHSQGDPYGKDHAVTFDAEINAVVDFRYSPSPKLTWWCDHHQTAFQEPAHKLHFEADQTGRKHYDPTAPSCSGLLVRWLSEQYKLDQRLFADHAQWADLIDAARFESPAQAVELKEPALQLMALLEAGPSITLVDQLITHLAYQKIEEVHREPEILRALEPVLQIHQRSIDLFRSRLVVQNGVAYFDLTQDGVEGFNKFIPYYLEPNLRYTVGLTASPNRAKVSVGSNPWHRPEPLQNLADLCRRYGGGGHPVVGAVTLPPHELQKARQVFLDIVHILRSSPSH